VFQTKLVSGKVTMVHRDLWPAVVAVATFRAALQLEGLSPPAKWLLESVDRQGSRQTDQVPLLAGNARKSIPPAASERHNASGLQPIAS
jgi:hypothetical protein